MPLKMLANKIAIKPIEDPEKTSSGLLYIPESARKRADHGIIFYRGPDVKELRVGDHVLFSGYDGAEVVTDEEGLFYVMKETGVTAIWEHGEAERMYPLPFINEMIERVKGNMLALEYDPEFVEEFTERFSSFLNDHLMAEEISF